MSEKSSVEKAIKRNKMTAKDIALIGMMIAVIEVSKIALAQVPNVELTTFWIILFTLYLGKRIFYVIPAFILIEGAVYGFHLWWVIYLYAWPLLALVTMTMRKKHTYFGCIILSGVFGLLFGLLCAIPYIFVGWFGINVDGSGLLNGLRTAFTWWVAGIPFDLVHGIANLVIMLVLYYPVSKAMQTAAKMIENK